MAAQTILIAEDDPDIRDGVRILLAGEGYHILEAENGTRALEIFNPEVDLVILDIMMPGMSGLRVCEELRKEYKILRMLMQNPERIFSVEMIYETVWGEPYYYTSNGTVMVHIRNLRTKIEADPQNPKRVCTVWGKGYRFVNEEQV